MRVKNSSGHEVNHSTQLHLSVHWRNRFLSATFTGLLLLQALTPTLADLPPDPSTSDAIFHITDAGINQWDEGKLPGQDMGTQSQPRTSPNWVYSNLCGGSKCGAQIPLVMRKSDDVDNMSIAQMKDEFVKQIKGGLNQALELGHREFEFQLIQNIDTKGYFNKEQQERVNKFGAAAYQAIGEIRKQTMQEKNLNVYTDATVGSNGTVMLTENIDSWSGFLQAIDLIDGRASMKATIATIDAVTRLTGKNTVRIFTAKGDWPAQNRAQANSINVFKFMKNVNDTWSPRGLLNPASLHKVNYLKPSIGNAHTVAEIKRQRPGTKTYFSTHLGKSKSPMIIGLKTRIPYLVGSEHVSRMNGNKKSNSLFWVQEIRPNKRFGFTLAPGSKVTYNEMILHTNFSGNTLQSKVHTRSPLIDIAPTSIYQEPKGRGGVLIAVDSEETHADLQELRNSILGRRDQTSLVSDIYVE